MIYDVICCLFHKGDLLFTHTTKRNIYIYHFWIYPGVSRVLAFKRSAATCDTTCARTRASIAPFIWALRVETLTLFIYLFFRTMVLKRAVLCVLTVCLFAIIQGQGKQDATHHSYTYIHTHCDTVKKYYVYNTHTHTIDTANGDGI